MRKALKRWRALLRLLARPLGEQADQMRAEARELMRALSGARDAQSALDALADLRKRPTCRFRRRRWRRSSQRLTDIKDAAEQTGFTKDMRDRLSRYLDYATLSLERWPLKAIDFDTVADGLISTYRRARQLLPDNWPEADAEHLHDLRRRVVEHRHQMDLMEPLWPRLGQVWAEEAQRLRNRLGACQDLAVLAGLTAPHQPLAPWRSRLAPVIEARRARASESRGAARRPAVCRKAEGVPPRASRRCGRRGRRRNRAATAARNKKPPPVSRAAAFLIDHRDEEYFVLGRTGSDLLFQVLRLSTIGAGEFYGRVRDGIGYRPPAKTTSPAKDE